MPRQIALCMECRGHPSAGPIITEDVVASPIIPTRANSMNSVVLKLSTYKYSADTAAATPCWRRDSSACLQCSHTRACVPL